MKQELNQCYKNAWWKLGEVCAYICLTIAAMGLALLWFIPGLVSYGIGSIAYSYFGASVATLIPLFKKHF
jgi:hypothetical protein